MVIPTTTRRHVSTTTFWFVDTQRYADRHFVNSISFRHRGWQKKSYARLYNRKKQEAQLSQRDRALLHVIKYFTKSPKVTQDHSKWHR